MQLLIFSYVREQDMIKYSQRGFCLLQSNLSLFCVWRFPTSNRQKHCQRRTSKSLVSPATFSPGSSQTKHPLLFLARLFCLCIYSAIHRDSAVTPAQGGILHYLKRKGRWDSRQQNSHCTLEITLF